jgi:hypothetical protein
LKLDEELWNMPHVFGKHSGWNLSQRQSGQQLRAVVADADRTAADPKGKREFMAREHAV